MQKVAVFGGIAVAAAVVIGVVVTLTSIPKADNESDLSFPITVDFARILQYENRTSYPAISRGYVMHIRLLYGEEGPPRPFYLLLSPQPNVWDQVTDPQQWVKEGVHSNHGFQVLSSSTQFDMFTELYPWDSAIIPQEMRLYCPDCEEKWSKPHIIWQGADTEITKIKGVLVREGPEVYEVAFALGNSQIDTLPASGTVEFRITDSIGVSLFETTFRVKETDFVKPDEPIRFLRIPMGGKAFYIFTIPTEEIKLSPTGKTTGFAFVNFLFDDGRGLSGGTRGVQLPVR